MSILIKFDYKELKQLANDKQSCVVEKTITQNLALEPWCLGNLKESIKSLLDHKIGKFVKELNGVLISFKNLRILQNVGAIKNDNSLINFQVQADYFIFQPYVGAILKGIVSKKDITHLVVLLYRVFNVVIPRPTEEKGNTWIGLDIQENQEVAFKVMVLDLYGALPYIRGELVESWIQQRYDSVENTVEPIQTQTNSVAYERKNGERIMPSTKNYNVPNKLSRNNDVTIDNNLIYQRQTADESEVNLHILKNKTKKYKEHTQKFSAIKQIDPKIKYMRHTEG